MEKRQKYRKQYRCKKKRNKIKGIYLCIMVGVCVLFLGNVFFHVGQSHAIEGKDISSSQQKKGDTEIIKENADVFENTAFLGNSYIETLKTYGMPKTSDFYSRVGLTVKSTFTKTLVNSDTVVIDAIDGKTYDKLFLVFGENELGWGYPQVFIDEYKHLIAEVKKRLPAAQIYVMAIIPVTEEISVRNEDNTNNQRIEEYNKLLTEMTTETGVTFIAPAPELLNQNRALIDEASTDGIHLNSIYCKKMVDNLKSVLEKERKSEENNSSN